MKRICPICKKEFIPHKYNHTQKYCSDKCQKIAFYKSCKRLGTAHPLFKGWVKKVCPSCNKKFRVRKYRKSAKYCSKKCSGIGRKKQKTYKCLNCKKLFKADPSRKRNFCSIKCYRKYTKGINHPSHKPESYVSQICKHCRKRFITRPHIINRGGGIFCSPKCCSAFRVGNKNPAWLGGRSFEPYTSEFNGTLKKKIKERDNYKCLLCGVPELECTLKHNVHHIDYDKSNSEEKNLITLCNNCHLKTITNRKYWENSFRQYNKNRLQEVTKNGKRSNNSNSTQPPYRRSITAGMDRVATRNVRG